MCKPFLAFTGQKAGAGRSLASKFGFLIEILIIAASLPPAQREEPAPGWEKRRWEGEAATLPQQEIFKWRRSDTARFSGKTICNSLVDAERDGGIAPVVMKPRFFGGVLLWFLSFPLI